MDAITFSTMLREWRHQCGYTDPQAATALGVATSTFCRWKNCFLPDELIVAAVVHRIRHGDDLAAVCVGPELALKMKDYRAHHGISQREAAHALGVTQHIVRGFERGEMPAATIHNLHFIRAQEILRRMERERNSRLTLSIKRQLLALRPTRLYQQAFARSARLALETEAVAPHSRLVVAAPPVSRKIQSCRRSPGSALLPAP